MADLLKRLKISEQQYGVGMEDNPFKDTSPDECMNVCFGGGGSPPPPPPAPATVTQQTSNIPEYFQPYLERLFERAEGVTTEPFQRYEGQRLAETTPEQKAAYAGVQDMVGGYKPYIGTADVLTAQAAQQSTDPMAVASRMNPYQQSVIDIQKREALRDAEKLQQQIGASAVGAGAFGGSRQALQETELARQTGQRLADIQAVGSQQAYQQALNQLAADRAASLAAGQQFAGLGTTQQQLGLAGLGALETVGQTKQAQQQRPLDIAYEDFARETTFPSQQVQQMSSVLRGFNLPTSTYATTQTQQAQPGFGQQLLGYGSGALGLYGAGKTFGLFKEGGDVNPGLKALAKEAPEAVENMGYDPDEVANAYVGGRMNFGPGGLSDIEKGTKRFMGDRTYPDGTPLPLQIGPEFFRSMGAEIIEEKDKKNFRDDSINKLSRDASGFRSDRDEVEPIKPKKEKSLFENLFAEDSGPSDSDTIQDEIDFLQGGQETTNFLEILNPIGQAQAKAKELIDQKKEEQEIVDKKKSDKEPSTIIQRKTPLMSGSNAMTGYAQNILGTIDKLESEIKGISEEQKGSTKRAGAILEGLKKAKQDRLSKVKEDAQNEGLMEFLNISKRIFEADPSKGLGAIAFGSLADSTDKFVDIAKRIKDIPVQEQEIALEAELGKLELGDKERAIAKDFITQRLATTTARINVLDKVSTALGKGIKSFLPTNNDINAIAARYLGRETIGREGPKVAQYVEEAFAETSQYGEQQRLQGNPLTKDELTTIFNNRLGQKLTSDKSLRKFNQENTGDFTNPTAGETLDKQKSRRKPSRG